MSEPDAGEQLTALSAGELVAGFRARDFTPSDVLAATLARIAERAERNAFYRLEPEIAWRGARAADARWAAGTPLSGIDGVPVTVKENIATVGTPLPAGTAACRDNPPATADGPVAALTRRAGAVRLGKTVMPDFGMLSSGVSSLHGVTRSPWNPAWTVGGSSSGAAAAAAGRMGALHLGSDIGGSLRLPAGWTGTVTLKPTFGIVPVDPPYLGRVIGTIARTVADVARHMAVLAQPDGRDPTQRPSFWLDWAAALQPLPDSEIARLRIGVQLDAGAGTPCDPAVCAAVRSAARLFESAGARVDELPPFLTPELLAALDLFLRARSWLDISRLGEEQRRAVLPFILDWAIGAADATGAAVLDAYQQVQALGAVTVRATAPYDIVLSPVAPMAAFPAEWPMPSNDPATSLHHIGFTAPYNCSEQPAASVNCAFLPDGRPVGLQLAGARFADVTVLRVAAWFESARPASATPVWPA